MKERIKIEPHQIPAIINLGIEVECFMVIDKAADQGSLDLVVPTNRGKRTIPDDAVFEINARPTSVPQRGNTSRAWQGIRKKILNRANKQISYGALKAYFESDAGFNGASMLSHHYDVLKRVA